MEDIKIIKADESALEEVAKLITDAFEQEGISRYIHEFSKEGVKEVYYRGGLLKLRLALEVGEDILLAIKDDTIVGVAILKRGLKSSLAQKVKILFPEAIKFFFSIIIKINLKKSFSIIKHVIPPKSLKKPYYTLEVIGVDPNYQGQGIGRKLLDEIHQITESNPEVSGVYLFADKKNKLIYEHFGYKVIKEGKGKDISIYHMFRENK
ncbi:GNAT family N-acetyltransferase [Halonatronum saccharophilum]|uniref:GNAT family N-acetyltransferase n=1 Tax=Halonatronum saccharophilum TaxID=150060 RepID=UPI000485F64C|nr:GNAT family N-acetyltransferase [Halonatronum saccharophilum]